MSTSSKSGDGCKGDDYLSKILKLNKDKIPVILETDSHFPPLKCGKRMILPRNKTIKDLQMYVMHSISGPDASLEHRTLFLICKNRLLLSTQKLGDCYDEFKDEKGILVLNCRFESAFGS